MSDTDGGLGALIREHLPLWHWQRIETGGTGRGIPDMNGCRDGHEVWIENKATSGWVVPLRPEQVGWIFRRVRAGGHVLILTRRRVEAGPRRGPARDQLWVHHGREVRDLAAHGLRDGPRPLMMSEGGPSRWLWPVVEELLLGGASGPAAIADSQQHPAES